MKRAGIIGSGIAGIATAIRLQSKGYRVTIFEKNSYPGGKLTQIELGGYRFDAGPSLFTMPQLVDELFQLAGKEPGEYFSYIRKRTICRYFWEDGTDLTAYADPNDFAEEAENKLGVPASRVKKFLGRSARKYNLTSKLFLEKSLHRLDTYLSVDTLKAISRLGSLDIFNTIHDANQKHLGNPKMVQLFDRFATYNGSNPYQAPGILTMIPHLEHNLGTFFPAGGMHAITMSLVTLATDLGVEFRLNENVSAINVSRGKVTGIQSSGEFQPFDLVVSNADIRLTYEKLLKRTNKKIQRAEPSSSAIIFYWGIRDEFPELDLHNIFFSDNYREEFEHIFLKQTIYHDPTVYINITSKENQADAPPGCENWFVMVNTPYDAGQEWDTYIKKTRAYVIDKVSRILNRDISELIEEESVLEPRSIESKTSSYAGALYGTSSNDRMAAFFRHPNFNREIEGLYHCGGSVHPGGGIPLCLLSAKIVSELTP